MNAILSIMILVVIAGSLIPLQSGFNAELNKYVGHPILAAAFNCLSAGVYLLAVAFLFKLPFPAFTGIMSAPWWAWAGGVCGATFVTINLMAAPKLGALLMMICFIFGTIIISAALDYFGLFGYTIKLLNPYRFMGIVLIGISAFLIYKGR